MKKIKGILPIFSILCMCILIEVTAVNAKEKLEHFDDNTGYDIYLGAQYGHDTIIKDVDILGVENVYGKMFLVVQPHGFNLKNVDGYILFDSIAAIVPKHEFKIQKNIIRMKK